jgi:exodeoxyribonuclease V alpha subunit
MHNERSPLKCDLLVVDEASMVDITLLAHVLRALPRGARIVIVGDKDQLPPVGPGNPFTELINHPRVPKVTLKRIYRQEGGGLLIENAHRINQGLFPILKERGSKDFLFFHQEDPQKTYEWVIDLAANRIPAEYGLDPMDAIQVLCPTRKGILGVESFTRGLQGILNPSQAGEGHTLLRPKDKVMQLRNDYEKDVYNGDMGRVKGIYPEEGTVVVDFYGREVTYQLYELDDLTLAYCISVHKSQGSEYPAVILCLANQHYPLLQRNLLYTAITRAKRLAAIVGTKKALAMAIRNDRPIKRFSGLASWF